MPGWKVGSGRSGRLTKKHPPIAKNAPPIGGAFFIARWVQYPIRFYRIQKLFDTVSWPMRVESACHTLNSIVSGIVWVEPSMNEAFTTPP